MSSQKNESDGQIDPFWHLDKGDLVEVLEDVRTGLWCGKRYGKQVFTLPKGRKAIVLYVSLPGLYSIMGVFSHPELGDRLAKKAARCSRFKFVAKASDIGMV